MTVLDWWQGGAQASPSSPRELGLRVSAPAANSPPSHCLLPCISIPVYPGFQSSCSFLKHRSTEQHSWVCDQGNLGHLTCSEQRGKCRGSATRGRGDLCFPWMLVELTWPGAPKGFLSADSLGEARGQLVEVCHREGFE